MEKFYKKFSIGLPLKFKISDLETFIIKYGLYINDFFFSLPIHDKFHSRISYIELLNNDENVAFLLECLKLIQKYNIKLQILFNTPNLNEHDIITAKNYLERNNIKFEYICILDKYYDIVKKYFPNSKLVLSFNNFIDSYSDLTKINKYSNYVIGRRNIRNNKLFESIKKELKGEVVLLLNNGCSHICSGCKYNEYCHYIYFLQKNYYSPEYLYALQSIFPFELDNKYINVENIDKFKLDTRNNNLSFIEACIDVYVNNNLEKYVLNNPIFYNVCGTLSWHMEYYEEFDYQRILKIKKDIYYNEIGKYKIKFDGYQITLNYLNKSFERFDLYSIINKMKAIFRNIPFQLKEIIVSNIDNIDYRIITDLKNNNIKISFLLEEHICLDKLNELIELNYIDCFIANDMEVLNYLYSHNIRFAVGPKLTNNHYEIKKNEIKSNLINYKGRFFDEFIYDLNSKYSPEFFVCDYNSNGYCVEKDNVINCKAFVNYSYEENNIKDVTEFLMKSVMENRIKIIIEVDCI